MEEAIPHFHQHDLHNQVRSSTPIASNVTGTSYTDTTVTDATTYYYTITAVNAVGEGRAFEVDYLNRVERKIEVKTVRVPRHHRVDRPHRDLEPGAELAARPVREWRTS